MLAFFMPKPPVPAVAKAFTTLSKSGIPPASSSTTSSTVMAMYIRYSTLVVSFILAVSLPTTGPGLSARRRCMLSPLPFASGTTAIMNTSTPMPPIQCVKERQ